MPEYLSKEDRNMRKNSKVALSLFIVFAMVAVAFFVTPVNAFDQVHKRVEVGATNPSSVTFEDIAWRRGYGGEDPESYSYAIAVGYKDNGGGSISGAIYRYDPQNPGNPWIEITYGNNANQKYYAVVYDNYSMSDTFYVLGTDISTSKAVSLKLESANSPSPIVSDFSPGSGASVFYGAYFDGSMEDGGSLFAVGTDGSNGVIMHWSSGGDAIWNSVASTGSGDSLSAVTYGNGNLTVVGNNSGAGSAVAYFYCLTNNTLMTLNVPSDAMDFRDVAWMPYNPGSNSDRYGLIVGKNSSGDGFVWGVFSDKSFANAFGLAPNTPVLNAVSWNWNGSFAMMVGDYGSIYMYYDKDEGVVVNWTDKSFNGDLFGVAIKEPGSPGYGLSVGNSASPIISYQVSDSSTHISVDTAYPHITRVEFRDQSNVNRVNQQVDVGDTYYFLVDSYYNVSGTDEWGSIDISIKAWYDGNSEIMSFSNAPAGGNIRFEIDYDDGTGSWNLVEPSTGEIVLGSAGTPYTYKDVDGNIHHVVSINMTITQQIRYAPGDGSWDAATNNHIASDAFNDADSWNFNVTVVDSKHPSAKDFWCDEFGIYAYTEVGAQDNPEGAGPPGSTIYLDRPSKLIVKSNLPYYVTVNVTDLASTSGHKITRDNIYVLNANGTDNTSANSTIYTWTNFQNGDLFVWGTPGSPPSTMLPVDNGLYTVGGKGVYDTASFTPVEWKVVVSTSIPEDHFQATITYNIGYNS